MIEQIEFNNQIYAIIIRSNYSEDGAHFFTPDDFSQQLAFMKHKKGHKIQSHNHKPIQRIIEYTKEVLIIKKGSLRVDFYNDDREFLESRVLNAGDIILLAHGGHGFEVLEDVEMVEVKQGPYAGDDDKIKF